MSHGTIPTAIGGNDVQSSGHASPGDKRRSDEKLKTLDTLKCFPEEDRNRFQPPPQPAETRPAIRARRLRRTAASKYKQTYRLHEKNGRGHMSAA